MQNGDGAAVLYFSVTDLVWFHDTENPTDPDPAPGLVTEVDPNGDGYMVEITLADESTQTIKHIGSQNPDLDLPVRWIEHRDANAGGLGG